MGKQGPIQTQVWSAGLGRQLPHLVVMVFLSIGNFSWSVLSVCLKAGKSSSHGSKEVTEAQELKDLMYVLRSSGCLNLLNLLFSRLDSVFSDSKSQRA